MTRLAPEAEVVHSLKVHLLARGLQGLPVENVLVDSQPSYLQSRFARSLEPVGRVPIDGAYPDLLCTLQRPTWPSVVGFEVKPSVSDWVMGLAQARRYRRGVHYAYLALPGPVANPEMEETARRDGIGLLLRVEREWREVLAPAQPLPHPWTMGTVVAALQGIPVTRRLQLNHPLNYLVVPWLAVSFPRESVLDAMSRHWPDLQSEGTRKHAIEGASVLGLIDSSGKPTLDGLTTAELLSAVGFSLSSPIDKRRQLAEEASAVAAVVRAVLLRQAAVRLVLDTLRQSARPLPTPKLFLAAMRTDELLARSLFLADPSQNDLENLEGVAFNPSAVFKFKQVLWHAGLLTTKAHSSAGGRATSYAAMDDEWALDERYLSTYWSGIE
ncbi:hypothetical protein F0U60_06480 [Archangium minus]|uniref:Uncharacterized protein n=1 Tax=Archangium minus TaxID=83450 RepID=A0ABY9WM09_9BACT|nr:hypothetical protein F0U60_06480 [Archangium minus]